MAPTSNYRPCKGGNHTRCQGAAHALQSVSAVTSLVVPVQNLRSSTFSAPLDSAPPLRSPGQVRHDAGGGKWGGRYRMTGPHLSGANRGVQSSERCSTVDSLITHTPSGTFYDPSIVLHGIAVTDYHKCSYVLVEYH